MPNHQLPYFQHPYHEGVGGFAGAYGKQLKRYAHAPRLVLHDVAVVTGVNPDNSYNVNIRNRNEDVLGIIARPFRRYSPGDHVTLVALRGDMQRLEISGFSARRLRNITGVVVEEYEYNIG